MPIACIYVSKYNVTCGTHYIHLTGFDDFGNEISFSSTNGGVVLSNGITTSWRFTQTQFPTVGISGQNSTLKVGTQLTICNNSCLQPEGCSFFYIGSDDMYLTGTEGVVDSNGFYVGGEDILIYPVSCFKCTTPSFPVNASTSQPYIGCFPYPDYPPGAVDCSCRYVVYSNKSCISGVTCDLADNIFTFVGLDPVNYPYVPTQDTVNKRVYVVQIVPKTAIGCWASYSYASYIIGKCCDPIYGSVPILSYIGSSPFYCYRTATPGTVEISYPTSNQCVQDTLSPVICWNSVIGGDDGFDEYGLVLNITGCSQSFFCKDGGISRYNPTNIGACKRILFTPYASRYGMIRVECASCTYTPWPPGPPTLSSPANGATGVPSTPAEISWLEYNPNICQRATSYCYQISTNATFTSLCANTSTIFLGGGTNLGAPHTYYWRVGTRNAAGCCFSTCRTFTTAVPGFPHIGLTSGIMAQSNATQNGNMVLCSGTLNYRTQTECTTESITLNNGILKRGC